MERKSFLEILMTYTPEELNEYIEKKGNKHKMINAITFLDEEEEKTNERNQN